MNGIFSCMKTTKIQPNEGKQYIIQYTMGILFFVNGQIPNHSGFSKISCFTLFSLFAQRVYSQKKTNKKREPNVQD